MKDNISKIDILIKNCSIRDLIQQLEIFKDYSHVYLSETGKVNELPIKISYRNGQIFLFHSEDS